MKLTELINRSGQVTFSTAITLLQPVYLYAHNWNKTDKVAEVVRKNENYILNMILIRGIDQNEIIGKYFYNDVLDNNGVKIFDYDTGTYEQALDKSRSWVDITSLIKHVYKDIGDINCIPIELQQFLDNETVGAGYDAIKLETTPNNYIDNDKYLDNSFNDVESLKYLNIRGLKLEDVTDKLFYKIKRSYGMLQKEESKYRRAVSVAAKVGLLFYERSLGKPSTRPAFLKAYKHEFDSIIKDDTLAKEIYSYLPEEYRGVAKPQDTSVDMLPIIKAAVYAGSIFDTDDVKELNELKSELVSNEYQLPSDDTLLKIIEAVKAI